MCILFLAYTGHRVGEVIGVIAIGLIVMMIIEVIMELLMLVCCIKYLEAKQ